MMSSIADVLLRWTVRSAAGVLALALFACAPVKPSTSAVPDAEIQALTADKPEKLRPLYAKVLAEGERNLVLNSMQVGVAALELEYFDLAEQAFDQALLRIESIYAGDENSARARSLWHEEGAKTFIGEPYERAMAYYYRGLLYMRAGDYENARACFKSGVLQDAFAEEEQYQADFALLYFLEGWASQMLGNRSLAEEAYAMVASLRPDFVAPPWDDNTLILLETGRSPRKVADGVGHSELKYRRGKRFKECRVACELNGLEVALYPLEDIFRQASTRGGRAIDKILEGKAHFAKSGMDIGTTLTSIGTGTILASAALDSTGGMNVGAGIAGVGGVVTIVAMNAKPHADTRYWNNLPDTVHFATFRGEADDLPGESRYFDASGQEQVDVKPILLTMRDEQDRFFWGRSRPVAGP